MSTDFANPDHTVDFFYDGERPLCVREIKLLRWLDCEHNTRFTHIVATDFSATNLPPSATR